MYTTDKVSSEKNNNNNNNNEESQYMVSHPETGSDSPIGSDQDWGRDTLSHDSGSDNYCSHTNPVVMSN